MKRIKSLVSILLVAILILSLAACGKTTEETNGAEKTNESEKKPDSTVSESNEVTLSIMHFNGVDDSGAEAVVYHEMANKFLSENPNVKLESEILSHDNYEQKIKTLAAANEMPDIFMVKGSMVDTFIVNSLIDHLNDDITGGWLENYKDGAFGDFTRDGNIYGVPFKLDTTSLVYYNEEIFEECGIDKFPETWTEFKDAIAKIKAKGYTPIALGNKGKWVAESCILSTLGDRFTGTEWFNSIRDGSGASFNDPEFVSSLAALQELALIGAFNEDLNSIDHEQQRTLFYNKTAAMFIEGEWALGAIEADAPVEVATVTGINIIPAVDGGKGNPKSVSGGAGWAWQINSSLTGEKREAAIRFLEQISGQEYATKIIENNGSPASVPGSYNESALSPLKLKSVELLSDKAYSPIYDIQLSPVVIETMNSGLQVLLINATTPEDLAAEIQEQYEDQ